MKIRHLSACVALSSSLSLAGTTHATLQEAACELRVELCVENPGSHELICVPVESSSGAPHVNVENATRELAAQACWADADGSASALPILLLTLCGDSQKVLETGMGMLRCDLP